MSCECNLIKLTSWDRNGSVEGNEGRWEGGHRGAWPRRMKKPKIKL